MTLSFARFTRAGLKLLLAAGLAIPAAIPAAAPALAQVSPDCGKKPEAAEGSGLWERDRLSGDWGGVRRQLQDAGIVLGMSDQNEFWASLAGGARRGAVYTGVTMLGLTLDPAKSTDASKALFWQGFCFFASAYQIRGRGPTPNLVGALQPVSNIEATRAFRLYDLWAEQSLLEGAVSVRLGQGGANTEFMVSQYGALFLNSSFGFPALAALGLPSGGPNYPLATPFVRLKWVPTENLTLLGAVFNANPAGPGRGDPQARDASGALFRMGDGALAFLEAQLGLTLPLPTGDLPGTYKLGAWLTNARFSDQAYDTRWQPLPAPWSNGRPYPHQGNNAVYGGFDQLIWRPAGVKEDDPRGIGLFAMLIGAPNDRNLVSFSATAGLAWKAPFEGRDQDSLGLAVAFARVGARARTYAEDVITYTGAGQPYRASETVLEATYAAQIAPWWSVQPSLQYVINTGAGIPNAASPAQRRLPNATVFGLRSTMLF